VIAGSCNSCSITSFGLLAAVALSIHVIILIVFGAVFDIVIISFQTVIILEVGERLNLSLVSVRLEVLFDGLLSVSTRRETDGFANVPLA
jgi:hypothetical protein